MTERENIEIALNGGIPEHTPVFWAGGQLMISSVICNCPAFGTKEGYDWWGVHWTATDNTGGMFTPTVGYPPVLTDITKWREQVKFPDISNIDWEAAAKRDTARLDPNKLTDFYGLGNGLFERLHFLMGFEEAMYALMEEPEECAALVSAIADFYIQIIEKVGKYYKPDYFTLLDDYAHKNGGLISPAMFREIIKPSLKRIVEAVEANGMKYIQHCCGQEQLFLDDFHDIGIRRIDPCQPCNDLPAMKKKYPDMGFMGGLDLQGVVDVPDVTEQQLRDEVDRCIREYGKTMGSYVIYGCSVDMYDPEAFKPGHKIGIIIDQAMKAAQ